MNIITVSGMFVLLVGIILLGIFSAGYSAVLHDKNEGYLGERPPIEWSPSLTLLLIGGVLLTPIGSMMIWYGVKSCQKQKKSL